MEAMANGPNFEPGNNNSTNLEINNATPVSDHQNLNPTVEFKPSSLQNLVTLATSSTNHTPDFDSRFSNHNSSYTNNWSNQEDNNEEDGYLDDSTVNEPPIHPGYKNHKSSSFTGGVRIKPSNPSHHEPAHPKPTRKFSKVVHEHEVNEDGEVWVKVPRNTNLFKGNHQNGNGWNDMDGSIYVFFCSVLFVLDKNM
ncbi:unnamed protein product [Lactuca virosa]|uniref:Uncharacterized protein n=1 Tax=Lactuca virosa TaxID=75947 RepID=A0AAU9LT40_9ASTR|nr:unnamed protein product [Lactuca virosa]